MWRFSFSKRRWPNEWAQVGWLGRQKLARMTSPGEEEGVDRWWRKMMLRVAIPAQTLLHLSTGPKAQRFQVRISVGNPTSGCPSAIFLGTCVSDDTDLTPTSLWRCFVPCSSASAASDTFSILHWFHPEALVLGHNPSGYGCCSVTHHVQLFATPGTAARQASLSFTISQSFLKLMSTVLVMPSNHLILLSPSPPALNLSSIRVFSNESAFPIRWPKYWSFSFSISPPNKHSGWFPLGLTGFILLSKGLSRVFSRLFTRVF